MSARLQNKAGAPSARSTGEDAGDKAYQVELPLASIARGDYLIVIVAAHGDEKTRALVPLRVLPF